MAEEVKTPAPPPPPQPQPAKTGPSGGPEGEKKPTAEKPAAAESAAPAKPAAPAGKSDVPPRPPRPPSLQCHTGALDLAAGGKISQPVRIGPGSAHVFGTELPERRPVAHSDILRRLREDEQFDYCVDVTAAHYPKREKQFDVIWILYSFARNERMRVKTQIADGASIASAVSIWPTANWLEREVYDMFGIRFDGHPDLKRILLPDGWKGYPLRKDYGILQQDTEWVQINLGIESGQ